MMTSGEILNSGFGEMLEKIFYNAPGGLRHFEPYGDEISEELIRVLRRIPSPPHACGGSKMV